MAKRPSRIYSTIFAVIAVILAWVIVRDYILEPEERDQPSGLADAPSHPE